MPHTIIANETFRSPHGRAILRAVRHNGDALYAIYVRLWPKGCAPDETPEIRLRCKPSQLQDFWRLAQGIVETYLDNGLPSD